MATYDNNEGNNGLYFIVGGLVVLALIGFFVFADNEPDVANISPAAGEATYTGSAEPGTPDRTSSTELEIDENGASTTTTTREQQ